MGRALGKKKKGQEGGEERKGGVNVTGVTCDRRVTRKVKEMAVRPAMMCGLKPERTRFEMSHITGRGQDSAVGEMEPREIRFRWFSMC